LDSEQDTIAVSGLSKTYRRANGEQVHAVKDLSLAVPSGCIFGFLGPNGAGKTTTIKMICGLVKPTSGEIWVNGLDVWQKRSQAMLQIGAVLEGTRNIHWTLSAWDNLIYFGHLKGMSGRSLTRRAEELLKQVELWDRRKDLVRVFSRGMQQKVAVACALIADPSVILLDEPTLGLDVQAARKVKELVVHLARDQGKTIVLTTHQLDMAQDVCDRIAIMSKGQTVTDRPTAELLDLFREEHYQLWVAGTLSPEAISVLEGMAIEKSEGGTLISGAIASQGQLYDLIARLRSFDLDLLSVNPVEPNLEEIFVHLVDNHMRQPEVGA